MGVVSSTGFVDDECFTTSVASVSLVESDVIFSNDSVVVKVPLVVIFSVLDKASLSVTKSVVISIVSIMVLTVVSSGFVITSVVDSKEHNY